jgi:hypothetical protein
MDIRFINRNVLVTGFDYVLTKNGIRYSETFLYLKNGTPFRTETRSGSIEDGDWERITRFVYRHTLEARLYSAWIEGDTKKVADIFDKIEDMSGDPLSVEK